MNAATSPPLRFGAFELDGARGELRRGGRTIAIQQQPLQLLTALLEQPGEIVSREALRHRIWGDEVNVEFDQGLNKCVTKLRAALRDSAAHPLFIETVPKRGYRFIAPVSRTTVDCNRAGADERTPPRSSRWRAATATGILAAVALISLSGSDTTRAPANRSRPAPSPIFAARDAYQRGLLALSRRTDRSLAMSVQLFERALAMSPRFADAHVALGVAWSLVGTSGVDAPADVMTRARDSADRALLLDPQSAGAYALLARTAHVFAHDPTTAESHFRRALALDPASSLALEWYAQFLSATGRHGEAISAAERAVAAAPRAPAANTALGEVLSAAGRHADAVNQLTRTLEIDPDFPDALRMLAGVRARQGEIGEAVAALTRVVQLNPESPRARTELAAAERRWARLPARIPG